VIPHSLYLIPLLPRGKVEEPPREAIHPADIALEAAEVIDPDANKTPEIKEAKDPIGVVDKVDPALTKNINNKLQEQGIGSIQFSTMIHIVGHMLRKGNLVFTCKFGRTLGKIPSLRRAMVRLTETYGASGHEVATEQG
jgi:hypothetical protein